MINDLQQELRHQGYTTFDTVDFCKNISTINTIENNLYLKLNKCMNDAIIDKEK